MRDHKFRIGRKGEVLYGKYNQSDNSFEYSPNCFIVLDSIWTLMPYIGLKDKHNKEVYEGDILKSLNGEYLEIFWHVDGYWSCVNSMVSTREIVGNIYETPELLK